MDEIIIGKHTLESLTTGMYADPFVIYREYIQNAADSIDAAIEKGIIGESEDSIDISLYFAEKRIVIRDNGLGLSSSEAGPKLLSIGNSTKTGSGMRGFRGIGRLSGLSYCSRLTFETSTQSEPVGTRVILDASKLIELLADSNNNASTVIDVLNKVYTIETYTEKGDSHYFSVIMDGVDDSVKLTDYAEVISYLSQNAPVPYDPEMFTWGREIIDRLSQKGYNIKSYHIFVSHLNKREPIYKPYSDLFLVDKGKNTTDNISDIKLINYSNSENEILAVGWIASTNYLGSIYDRTIKGIRLRKGNILIGDSQTLNVVFKDARFNGWSVGEIFALHPKLVPNARRDNFEKNPTYFSFIEKLATLANNISKDIRRSSLKRNIELSAAIEATEKASDVASKTLQEGLSTFQKNALQGKLTNVRTAVRQAALNDEADAYYQEIAFEELDMLIGTIQGSTSFKALNTMKGLSSLEKKVLEKVLKLIIEYDSEKSTKLIDFILTQYLREDKSSI